MQSAVQFDCAVNFSRPPAIYKRLNPRHRYTEQCLRPTGFSYLPIRLHGRLTKAISYLCALFPRFTLPILFLTTCRANSSTLRLDFTFLNPLCISPLKSSTHSHPEFPNVKMRTIKFVLFLLGLLALFTASVPVERTANDVGYLVARPRNANADDGAVHLIEEEEDPDAILEKRASKKAKKPAPKKTTPTKPAPKGLKKSAPSPKAKKPAPSPKPKKCTRADNSGCGKTDDYKVAENAAAKKKKTLQLNQAYLLVFKDAATPVHHQQLVVGTVRRNKEGELDFLAVGSDLQKDLSDPSKLVRECQKLHGASCSHRPINEYSCAKALNRKPGGRFKFVSNAAPEFADPETFWTAGKRP